MLAIVSIFAYHNHWSAKVVIYHRYNYHNTATIARFLIIRMNVIFGLAVRNLIGEGLVVPERLSLRLLISEF